MAKDNLGECGAGVYTGHESRYVECVVKIYWVDDKEHCDNFGITAILHDNKGWRCVKTQTEFPSLIYKTKWPPLDFDPVVCLL